MIMFLLRPGTQAIKQGNIVEDRDPCHRAECGNVGGVEIRIERTYEVGFAGNGGFENGRVGCIPDRKVPASARTSGHNQANRFQKLDLFINLFFRKAEQGLHSGVSEDACEFDYDLCTCEKDVFAGDQIEQKLSRRAI